MIKPRVSYLIIEMFNEEIYNNVHFNKEVAQYTRNGKHLIMSLVGTKCMLQACLCDKVLMYRYIKAAHITPTSYIFYLLGTYIRLNCIGLVRIVHKI